MGLPLWCGARSLDEYLAKGGNLNAAHPESGWTLLHDPAEQEDASLIIELIAKGADLDARDFQGWTPLHWAVDIAIDGALQEIKPIEFALVRTFVEAGASLDARNNEGQTPRDVAAAHGSHALRLFDEAIRDANEK